VTSDQKDVPSVVTNKCNSAGVWRHLKVIEPSVLLPLWKWTALAQGIIHEIIGVDKFRAICNNYFRTTFGIKAAWLISQFGRDTVWTLVALLSSASI
jgi:hypothetical protein